MRGRSQRRTAIRLVLMLAIALAALVAGTVGVNAATVSNAAAPSSPLLRGHPTIVLPGSASGSSAVNALGVHLPDVAKAYGWTASQLSQRFNRDKHLFVDGNGYLFYKEAAASATDIAGAATASGPTAQALAPLTDTFKLHSLPGAAHIVYLDFDGYTLHADAWTKAYNGGNDIVAPPFDTDGNPASFSDTELTAIQQIWQRVSEDYAPFNVDVTTEYMGEDYLTRSSSSDNLYGNRVLISPISSYVGQYGGVSYVGVFNAVGDYYKTSLVFPEMLAKNERYIAEAASHENGHSLGLSHMGTTTGQAYYQGQGSGVTGWAPIMGVGYYQSLTQWAKGEYANANNTEDEIAIVQTYGAALKTDDVGNSPATAAVLNGSGALSASGIVGTSTDADYYQVTSGVGTLTASVVGADLGPNLDAVLELRDGNNNLIASNNPDFDIVANLSVSVAPGTYYLVVHGTGRGNPLVDGYSAYGSLGQYTLSANVPAPGGNIPPVASFTALPATSGLAPLAVNFDGTASKDPDGTIVDYSWNFGDGSPAASGATTSHTYTTPGTYTATLTVTDDLGASGSKSTTITVTAPNQPPTAKITANPISGYAPLAVSFSGTGSSDPDGTIASYGWTFGDGGTSTAASVSHTYSAVGTYTATLKVTDNQGATATATVTITTTQNPAKVLRVASVTVTRVSVRGSYRTQAVVKIVNGNGTVVSGVTVTGTFTGVITGTVSGKTGTAGTVTLQSSTYRTASTATFTVTNVTKSGYVWVK